jgi:hypothetical protein
MRKTAAARRPFSLWLMIDAMIADSQWTVIPLGGQTAIMVFVALMLIGTSIGFHTLWARRNEGAMREQIESVKPFMRSPHDATFLFVALLADAFLLLLIVLAVRSWLG